MEEDLGTLRCFVLAGAFAGLSFMTQPLQRLNGFELCHFLLLRLLTVWILVELWDHNTKMTSLGAKEPTAAPQIPSPTFLLQHSPDEFILLFLPVTEEYQVVWCGDAALQ